MKLDKILFAALLVFAPAAFAANPVPVSSLYKSLKTAGFETQKMSETKDRVLVSGVVVKHFESVLGNSVLIATDVGSKQEYARLYTDDKEEEQKLSTLKAGVKFVADCVIEPMLGTIEYLPLNDCRLVK
jgi:hypothetical protein